MKLFLLTVIFLAGTVLTLPYALHPHYSSRRFLHEEASSASGAVNDATKIPYSVNEPPKAKKVRQEMKMFGDVRVDNYYWLRDDSRSDPHILEYLHEENNYTDLIMSGTKYFQDEIYAEIKGRFKEDDITTPRRRGPYYYYERTLEGLDYVQYCRRLAPNNREKPSVYDVMPIGPDSPLEHVILDENLKAQGHGYYKIDTFEVSPNQKLVAYAEDIKGNEIYTVYVIDAETRKPVGKSLVGVTSNVVWAGDEALIYVTMDATLRPEKVWLYKLGKEQTDDLCLYHEKDDIFSVYVEVSESEKFVFVGSESKITSFNFYFDVAKPEQGIIPLTPRLDGIDTAVSHRGTHFFIKRRSDEFYNSELLACPVENVSAITVILPHRESVKIEQMLLFSDHLVAFERENGLIKMNTYHLPPVGESIKKLRRAQAVEFVDPVYEVKPSYSQFSSSILRFTYSSLRTPRTVFDYDMNTRASVTKKIQSVLGGFNSSNYITKRQWATAHDGIHVPISIVYRKDLVKLDGSNPLLLYGYGSYEHSSDPSFKTSRLSLLDRGFIYVIAHVRGGGEMGRQWYENGKLLKKKNTFTDFIACAEYLIEMKYCTKEKLVIEGASAGGLLIGAVLNMRPDLFKAAIAEVPFVDIVTTMLDSTIPLTTEEYEEWGDPRKEEFYYYMKSYSPVDNVSAQKYPSILVTAGLNDPRVLYSEPAKFVAKLRDLKTDDNIVMFKCEFSAGHFAKSGRFEMLEDDAFIYTYIFKSLDMIS